MPRPDQPGAATVAYLRSESQRIAELCTACGACVTACPMTTYTPSTAAADPAGVVRGVLDLLRGGPSHQAALDWVAACTRSGLCTDACPEEGFDPAFMLRLAKMQAKGALDGHVRIPSGEDVQFAPKVKAFARLTMTAQEQEQWL